MKSKIAKKNLLLYSQKNVKNGNDHLKTTNLLKLKTKLSKLDSYKLDSYSRKDFYFDHSKH